MSVTKGGSVKTASDSVVANRDILALANSQGFDLVAGFEPRKSHIYTVTRAISARVNQNFDGFPSEELKKAYKTFLGKPVFVNHANEDPTRSRGRIVGVRYVENADDKYIEVIQEVNAQKYPLLAKELVDAGLDSVSMGCSAERTICSFCGNTATGMFDMCAHVLNSKGKKLRRQAADGSMEDVLVYEECRDLGFFELSYVFDPADETAVVSTVLTASRKNAELRETNRVWCDLPGCNRWTNYSSERYDQQWVNGGGEMRTYDYCCEDHRAQYEKQHPNWAMEAAVANPIKFYALQRQAFGEIEAPPAVDTLRDEAEDEEEEFHHYVDAPAELSDPDLEKARQLDRRDEVGEGYEDFSDYLQDEQLDDQPLDEDTIMQDPDAPTPGPPTGTPGSELPPGAETPPGVPPGTEPDATNPGATPLEVPTSEDMDDVLVDPGDPEVVQQDVPGEDLDTVKPDLEQLTDEVAEDPELPPEDPDELVDTGEVPPVQAPAVQEQKPVAPTEQRPLDPNEQDTSAPQVPTKPEEKAPAVSQPPTNEQAPKPPKPDEVAPASPPKTDKPNNKSPEEHAEDQAEKPPTGDKPPATDNADDDEIMKDPGDPAPEDSAENALKVDDDEELPGLADQLGISEDELVQLDPEDLIRLLDDAEGSDASDDKEKKMPSATNQQKTQTSRKDNTMSEDSLAQRGRVASRGRVADQSRNDQGEMEETFITQTPPEEPVETGEGEGDAPNTEESLVATIRAAQAKLKRVREAKQRKAEVGDGPTSEGEQPSEVNPELSGTDEQDLKGDDFESPNPNDGVEETQPKDAAKKAAMRRQRHFASWVRRTAGKAVREANSVSELRTWVSGYCKAANINPEVMYPLVKADVLALRKRASEEGTSGAKKADAAEIKDRIDKGASTKQAGDMPEWLEDKVDDESDGDSDTKESRKKADRRKIADEKLDVAAPDGRVDVERPTSDDTDDEAQASQFDKHDFGNNAGDDKADPDLSTDQNWAPGEGKQSSRASGVQAVRLARAYITAGLEDESAEWTLAAQFEGMSKATVIDRLALLDRVIEAGARRPIARKTAGNRGSVPQRAIPQNLSAAVAPAPQQRVAANDSSTDSDLFL